MEERCSSDCNDVLERLELYLDGESGDFEAFVAQHLGDCSPCLGRAEFERRLRELVAGACRDRAPAGLVERVVARLHVG